LTTVASNSTPTASSAPCALEETQATILVPYGYAETVNMVGKKRGHGKVHEVGQFLSKTAPFLVIDSSPSARQGFDEPLGQALDDREWLRDTKDLRFGMGMGSIHVSTPDPARPYVVAERASHRAADAARGGG
jgi:hypothetical protein